MARMVDTHAEKVFKSGRQSSDASTTLPPSDFSRACSPTLDSEFDAEFDEIQEFALEGLPDDTCEYGVEEKVKAMQPVNALGCISENTSNAQPAQQVMSTHAGSESVLEKYGLEKCVLLGLTLSGLCQYHYSISLVGIICVIMSALAALMVLPGIYLYIVEGCRPEGCEEDMVKQGQVTDKIENGVAVLLLAIYSLAFVYGLGSSFAFRCIMGGTSLAMLLPGSYLFVFQGCRPEDCKDD